MADRSWSIECAEQVPGWIRSEMKDDFAGESILLVEDDPDIRDLMSTLLRLAGFEPTVCGSAEVALEQLREQPFDLVLTDYALPNRTGGWLLKQAKAEGLLDATPALVVTAHPNPPDVSGFEVIPKPFDLDDLVSRVRRRLEGSRGGRQKTSGGKRPQQTGAHGDDDGDCPEPVELVLYVNAESPKSVAAIANIQRVLARFESSRVRLTIHDLSQDPQAGAADAVAITPTLVKRSPGPRMFILGHITNDEVLVELLQACGQEPA